MPLHFWDIFPASRKLSVLPQENRKKRKQHAPNYLFLRILRKTSISKFELHIKEDLSQLQIFYCLFAIKNLKGTQKGKDNQPIVLGHLSVS